MFETTFALKLIHFIVMFIVWSFGLVLYNTSVTYLLTPLQQKLIEWIVKMHEMVKETFWASVFCQSKTTMTRETTIMY